MTPNSATNTLQPKQGLKTTVLSSREDTRISLSVSGIGPADTEAALLTNIASISYFFKFQEELLIRPIINDRLELVSLRSQDPKEFLHLLLAAV